MTPGTVRFANGASVKVEILESPEEQRRGLMDRTSLPEDEGALFWLGERRNHFFWMRRTRIPLDLIYLDYDQVVGVLTLQPLDETRRSIGRLSSSVLECNGGWAARHNVAVGEKFQIDLGA